MVMCTINLENNARAVYCAGQLLKGTIDLYLDEPMKLRGLYFFVYGVAKCHWTETNTETTGLGENRRTITKTDHFKGKDVYLNFKTYLIGSQEGGSIEVSSGTHRYDFSCQLPEELPASFEASFGYVRYSVDAVLDIPWSEDKRFKLQFTVYRHDDLNEFPDLKSAHAKEEMRNFCCLFCHSEPLVMTVTIPQAGFVPGQKIPITINYLNKTRVEVLETKINLKRVIGYNSKTPFAKAKFETDDIVEAFVEGVKRFTSYKKIDKVLDIPKVLLKSNGEYCKAAEIFYELKVEAILSGFHKSMKIFFPIVIGSIPLIVDRPRPVDRKGSLPNPSSSSILPLRSGCSSPLTPLLELGMLESPPPTFDEALKMKKDKKEPTQIIRFVSKFPNDP